MPGAPRWNAAILPSQGGVAFLTSGRVYSPLTVRAHRGIPTPAARFLNHQAPASAENSASQRVQELMAKGLQCRSSVFTSRGEVVEERFGLVELVVPVVERLGLQSAEIVVSPGVACLACQYWYCVPRFCQILSSIVSPDSTVPKFHPDSTDSRFTKVDHQSTRNTPTPRWPLQAWGQRGPRAKTIRWRATRRENSS